MKHHKTLVSEARRELISPAFSPTLRSHLILTTKFWHTQDRFAFPCILFHLISSLSELATA